MDLVGFTGGVVKPLGKIELEVVFGDDGLFRTIVAEKKQMIENGASKKNLQEEGPERVDLTEQTLVNPAYPDQLVTIGGYLSEEYSDQRGGRVGECGNSSSDFKNLNSAYPEDYYPLPDIDGKIESVVGFRYKCFLDAYKGYHQVQMAQEDEEKTAFYTDCGMYFYRKMPFGLKNVGATYQRLVDTAF
ncbi:hypothetical protein Tco_1336726 [Tanacetum coccineum]